MKTVQHIKNNKRKGFTLVEVIVVLMIISILSSIVYPAITGYIDNAEEKRLMTITRRCVESAQALATEDYGLEGDGGVTRLPAPSPAEIMQYANVTEGSVSGVSLCSSKAGSNSYGVSGFYTPTINYLTYTDEQGLVCTYVHDPDSTLNPDPHYVFNNPVQFEIGQTYTSGQLMTSNGYIFRCIRDHTTGTTSRTRDPSLRSNKSTWEVIGYVGAPLDYSSTVRYAPDTVVRYKGNLFSRTDFNLVGGQVPYYDPPKSSDYWIYVGPADSSTTTP